MTNDQKKIELNYIGRNQRGTVAPGCSNFTLCGKHCPNLATAGNRAAYTNGQIKHFKRLVAAKWIINSFLAQPKTPAREQNAIAKIERGYEYPDAWARKRASFKKK